MRQTLTLELSDPVYTAIRRQAEATETSPVYWIATTLEQQYGYVREYQGAHPQRTEAEKIDAARHVGASMSLPQSRVTAQSSLHSLQASPHPTYSQLRPCGIYCADDRPASLSYTGTNLYG